MIWLFVIGSGAILSGWLLLHRSWWFLLYRSRPTATKSPPATPVEGGPYRPMVCPAAPDEPVPEPTIIRRELGERRERSVEVSSGFYLDADDANTLIEVNDTATLVAVEEFNYEHSYSKIGDLKWRVVGYRVPKEE